MGAVTIRDVRKTYGAHAVMHGVSVDIADGEFVVLVGPSGCGKSTLLRMLAGLEDITSGTIAIDDKVVNGVAAKERDIAMVFQSYALYPHMTVAQNMGFSLKLSRADKAEAKARVLDAARMLDLEPLLERFPKQLSGGQRQRVAMGRAMVRKPKVFLFDEPLSNLDAKLRVQMRSEIKQNHAKLKTTTVYVTHDQIEAMTMADRIVVMHAGIVEQIGTPLDLYDAPANLFVASFIGSPGMNLLPGRVQDGAFAGGDGARIILPQGHGAAEGRAVTLGVRPEHLALEPGGSPAAILTIEPTGSETQVVMRFAGQDIMGAFRQRLRQQPGDSLSIGIDPARIHLFDTDTGARINGPAASELY